MLFPVLKHKSSQLRQLPVSWPNYFLGERKIKEADSLSLGEICKLKKVKNKFIRSQAHLYLREKPLESCWLAIVRAL